MVGLVRRGWMDATWPCLLPCPRCRSPCCPAPDPSVCSVVLWELLTWEVPFGSTNPWQVVTIVTEGGRLEFPPRDRLPGPDSQVRCGGAGQRRPGGGVHGNSLGRHRQPQHCRSCRRALQIWSELDRYCQLVERCWAQEVEDRPPFKEIIIDLRWVAGDGW